MPSLLQRASEVSGMCSPILEVGGELLSTVRSPEEDEEPDEVIVCPYCGWERCQCCSECDRDVTECVCPTVEKK